jgi:sirohydrochlorin cobaltochelatase
MPDSVEQCLEALLPDPFFFGQVLVRRTSGGRFVLCHRDDEGRDGLRVLRDPEDAVELARYDDAGDYRPLKTAPNLRHGWMLEVMSIGELRRALDYFYPGRLAVFAAWNQNQLAITPLRQTLDRQSGMYRVAAKISDEQINDLVARFCRSDGGCLRTILWKRDGHRTVASTKLSPAKFDVAADQARSIGSSTTGKVIPLLCQEACNLLVSAARKVVTGE